MDLLWKQDHIHQCRYLEHIAVKLPQLLRKNQMVPVPGR
jgi:hypothetical protein